MKKLAFFLFLIICTKAIFCQSDSVLVYKNGAQNSKAKLYALTQQSIKQNLSLALTTETEENWQDAFNAIEVINYQSALVNSKVALAFTQIQNRTPQFQRSLLELCYAKFPVTYNAIVKKTFDTVSHFKILAMCGEYLLLPQNKAKFASAIYTRIENLIKNDSANKTNPFLISLAINARFQMGFAKETPTERALNLLKYVPDFLSKDYLPGNVIVYSFQRKNRNYPGLAIVRSDDGSFVKDKDDTYFSVPQLARSINNLPGYLTNGNTPQGVFKMNGFDVSKLDAIGPTENLQLALPVECTKQQYFNDSAIADNNWQQQDYKNILPKHWRGNVTIYEAFFAGLAGRTEIIAHGTTVNPEYYKGQPYYPHTPTEGCLCTKEIWSNIDGKRVESNQQKLIDAVKKAGGANGYLIVINIEDEQKPVTLKDILPYLKQVK